MDPGRVALIRDPIRAPGRREGKGHDLVNAVSGPGEPATETFEAAIGPRGGVALALIHHVRLLDDFGDAEENIRETAPKLARGPVIVRRRIVDIGIRHAGE